MIFVREYGGSGPVAVLLHGGPGAPGSMAPLARRLAGTHRVLEPFQRGSGKTPLTVATHVEDLHEVLVACAGAQRPALIGSCWGAILALAYASAHPEWAGPLVLVGCRSFHLSARQRMQQTLDQRMTEPIRGALAHAQQLGTDDDRLKASAHAIRRIFSYEPHAANGEERLDPRAQQETWNDLLRLHAEGIYPQAFVRVQRPVLMIHGDHDPHPGRMIHSTLKPYLPQMEYLELERCGHYPWHEHWAAEEFFSSVHGWLAGAYASTQA